VLLGTYSGSQSTGSELEVSIELRWRFPKRAKPRRLINLSNAVAVLLVVRSHAVRTRTWNRIYGNETLALPTNADWSGIPQRICDLIHLVTVRRKFNNANRGMQEIVFHGLSTGCKLTYCDV
jgi:hypothetical protein